MLSISDPTNSAPVDEENSAIDELMAPRAPEESGLQVSEPTQGGGIEVETVPSAPEVLPTAIALRPLSGRYRGTLGAFQLEVRVDVDRRRPMKRISGDFFQVSGGTTSYFGSFTVDAPTITTTTSEVVIKGLGRFTFAAGAPIFKVTIQRRAITQPPAPANVQFYTTAGSPGALYTCSFASVYFRTVRIETDRVSDVTTPPFTAYNTG